MENSQEFYYTELIEKNRKVLNSRLNNSIRQTGNKIYGLFYDMLNNGRITKTKEFTEKLKQENAKPTRIKRWEFHYKRLDSLQQRTLKILRQFFDKKFIELASDNQIGGLDFNQDLKDIVRFDFIFGYIPHNPITSDDTGNYIDRFFLQGGYSQLGKTQEKKEKQSPKKHKIWLPQGHRLLNAENYSEYKQLLLSGVDSSITKYSSRLDINIKDPINYKKFLESYFIYILKDSLLENKLVFDMKTLKDLEILKIYIQDLIAYLEQKTGNDLDLDKGFITKKFFRNTGNNCLKPSEFIYSNTTIEDILARQKYFDQTYFTDKNISSKVIYTQIMEEFETQGSHIKASHALLSPDYFILKDKSEKLKSDLYILNNCPQEDINIQSIIDSINEELSITMTKLDKHFYSRIDNDNKKGKGDSMEKITHKYMKYYKIPMQYRRNFFILINYFNHYHGIKNNIYQKAQAHNKKLEDLLLNSCDLAPLDLNPIILHFLNEYMTSKQIKEAIQKKRNKNYQIKINKLKTLILSNAHTKIEDNQLSLNL